ncbi:unnamed protein product [Oppiella nova]|uniref:Uncharacterized protein n=1 Tax=Oppiella nova TaxID=334625 RepID=A0A7R9MR39_9ACAR|nr:unnamed protein product [Oppiella nova]CAG2181814.1 unnamed protein product [Oppiella nova]
MVLIKHLIVFIQLALLAHCLPNELVVEREEANYAPNWDSIDKRPLPAWYDESKIGRNGKKAKKKDTLTL